MEPTLLEKTQRNCADAGESIKNAVTVSCIIDVTIFIVPTFFGCWLPCNLLSLSPVSGPWVKRPKMRLRIQWIPSRMPLMWVKLPIRDSMCGGKLLFTNFFLFRSASSHPSRRYSRKQKTAWQEPTTQWREPSLGRRSVNQFLKPSQHYRQSHSYPHSQFN